MAEANCADWQQLSLLAFHKHSRVRAGLWYRQFTVRSMELNECLGSEHYWAQLSQDVSLGVHKMTKVAGMVAVHPSSLWLEMSLQHVRSEKASSNYSNKMSAELIASKQRIAAQDYPGV